MKFKSINLTYILFLILSAALCGCRDDFPFDGVVVGDGVAAIEGTFSFEPFGVALESRSPGDATKKIESLYMFVYDEQQQLYKNGAFLPDGFTELDITLKDENNERPSNDNATSAETNTPKGTFNFRLPFGKYYIYLVANTDVSAWTEEDNYGNLGLLLNNVVKWEGIGSGNNANALPNKQMLGYMTADNTLSFDSQGQLKPDATVTLNKKHVQLNGWLKRVSSKLTIAFDVSDLNDNTWIYIKSVRILDIPKECYLGKKNYVMGEDEKGRDGISDEFVDNSKVETFYFANADASQSWDDGAAHYRKWLELSNADSVAGYWSEKNPTAVDPDWSIEQRLAAEHSETAPALYFLENVQGKGKDKRQDANGDNTIDFPNGGTEGKDGYKDNKKYGSYVEVEAYYVCQDRLNQSQGKIKYRFMLGKDVLTDYNAERNHHYKLTLKFNGYANDIDWHIEYREEAYPGFQVPEIVYVSYSYNMGSDITLRATPKSGYSLQKIDAVIVENEWWPNYDDESWSEQYINKRTKANQSTGTYKPWADWIAYRDNNNVVTNIEGEKVIVSPSSEFGFLSLRKIIKDIYELGGNGKSGTYPGVDKKGKTYDNTSQLTINFRDIYFTVDNSADQDMSGPKYRRSYGNFGSYTDIVPTEDNGTEGKLIEDSKNDGAYTIYLNTDANGYKNYVFVVPLYTRAKTLDSWAVYSGANQFLGARRKAKVQFIATYVSDSNPTDKYTESKFTTVYQDYRMGNPRGIFRRGSNLQPFRVTLMNSAPKYSRVYDDWVKGIEYHQYNTVNPTTGAITKKGGIEDLMEFKELISQGTWTATILRDPHGLVKLTKGTQVAIGQGSVIRGLTGSTISFTYTPRHTVPDNGAEGAIIQVRYHNGTCVHNILVRQGYGNVKFPYCNLEWATCNVYQAGEFCKSPLAIGSLYRRHTALTHGIAESNIDTYGLRCLVKSTDTFRVLNGKGQKESNLTWGDLDHSPNDATENNAFGTFTIDGKNYKLPDYKQVSNDWIDKLWDTEGFTEEQIEENKVHMAYGIAYADGATSTLRDSRAISFSDYENKGKDDVRGTRGCFAYSYDGSILFFPFGETGHAHRKGKRWYYDTASSKVTTKDEYGFNAYGSVDVRLGGYATGVDAHNLGNSSYYAANQQRPMAYDLPGQQGGIYWINYNGTKDENYISLDFNFTNLMTAYSAHGNIDRNSNEPDAGAIKPVTASSTQ